MPAYRREPTNRELRERVIVHLKETPLCANVSVRLLADLVDRYDLLEAPPSPDSVDGLDPAILVVPEAPVMIFDPHAGMPWPFPMAIPPGMPPQLLPISLTVGAHLRNLGALAPVGSTSGAWAPWRVGAAGHRPVRVFQLSFHEFKTRLPRVLVNALNLSVAGTVVA